MKSLQSIITLIVIAVGLTCIVWAGSTEYRVVKYTGVSYAAFDTVEVDTSETYEIGDNNNNPVELRFFTRLVTSVSSVDTGYIIVNMDISADRSDWYDYCDVDTIEIDTTVALIDSTILSDAITIPPVRYYRLRTQNAVDCSTFVIYNTQLWENADDENRE